MIHYEITCHTIPQEGTPSYEEYQYVPTFEQALAYMYAVKDIYAWFELIPIEDQD